MVALNESLKQQGIDELNLAEFPICLLTTRMTKDKTIQAEDTIMDSSTGEPVHRKVTVYESPLHGLPTADDQDILMALIQHTKDINNFTNRRVEFSRYRLLKIMNWNDESKNYKRVEESLHRWAQVSILFENSWRDRARAKWTTITAHILDRVEINRMAGRRPQDPDEEILSWADWGQDVFNSIRAGNTKSINMDFYYGLESAVSKRMYRYLDKKFYQSKELRIDLHKLAYDKLGITRTYKDTAQIKRRLDDAIDELVCKKYLESTPDEERYEQVTRGKYNVILVRKQIMRVQEQVQNQPEIAKTNETSPIVKMLVEIGIELQVAITLSSNHTLESIQRYISYMDWKIKQRPDSINDRAAWLIQALRQQFQISDEFTKQKNAKQDEAKRNEEIIKKSQDRRTQQAKDENEFEQIQKYLKTRTEEEQETMFQEGLTAEAKETLNNSGPTSPIWKMIRRSAIETKVRAILNLTEETTAKV